MAQMEIAVLMNRMEGRNRRVLRRNALPGGGHELASADGIALSRPRRPKKTLTMTRG